MRTLEWIRSLGIAVLCAYSAGTAGGDGELTNADAGVGRGDAYHLEVGGAQYRVMRMGEYVRDERRLRQEKSGYSEVYYVKASGSLSTMLGSAAKEAESWRDVRILPVRAGDAPGGIDGVWGYSLVFERPVQHEHVSMLPKMWDWATPTRENVESVERLYVSIMDIGYVPKEDELREYRSSGRVPMRYIVLPGRADETLPAMSETVQFDSEFEANAFVGNMRVRARVNYADVSPGVSIWESRPAVIEAVSSAVMTRRWLEQPFPASTEVLKPDVKLIGDVDVGGDNNVVGKEVTVKMSFTKSAILDVELVRLKCDNGGFRRMDGEVVYCPEKAGVGNLVLEALAGIRKDGKVVYADKREIRIRIGAANEGEHE